MQRAPAAGIDWPCSNNNVSELMSGGWQQSEGLLSGIQRVAHRVEQAILGEGLGQKIQTFSQGLALGHRFGAVTRGIDHFEVRVPAEQPLRQNTAANSIRHDHVGQHEFYFFGKGGPVEQRLGARAGLDHTITVAAEHRGDVFTHLRFILNHQDRLPAEVTDVRLLLLARLSHARRGRLAGYGEKNPETGPLARVALDLDPALVLFDNPVNRGQAKTRPSANRLGGEEWLEDSADGRVLACPRFTGLSNNTRAGS